MDCLNGLMGDVTKEIIQMINKEGVGLFFWPDGRIYEGYWKNGKQSGYGRYVNQQHEEKYGYWNQGKRERWLDQNEFDQACGQGNFDFLSHP
jgi:hypothetical protein